MELTMILGFLVAALISGGIGYCISLRFNRSNYAKTDRSGDFGTPRGGFFALLSGTLIGMMLTVLLSHIVGPQAFISGAMMGSIIGGAVGGVIGMFRGTKNRSGDKSEE